MYGVIYNGEFSEEAMRYFPGELIDKAVKIAFFKKEEIKNEIKALDAPQNASKENVKTNPLLKPFKYVEVFLLSVFSFILNNTILFYGLLVIIIFFILRFIWKKIF